LSLPPKIQIFEQGNLRNVDIQLAFRLFLVFDSVIVLFY